MSSGRAGQATTIVQHELGHVVGLDHVDDPGQLMYRSNKGQVNLGPGDVEGLAIAGAGPASATPDPRPDRPACPGAGGWGRCCSPTCVPDRPAGAAPDPDALYDAFTTWTADQGLTLYPAQDEAVIEVFTGSNLVLSTPTGSGKSLVATAAHFAALAAGRRSYYTAPIKALVSEKFFALCQQFGVGQRRHGHRRRRRQRGRADHRLHRGGARQPGAARGASTPTWARSSWTSSTSTATRSAAGPGRCRSSSCRRRSSSSCPRRWATSRSSATTSPDVPAAPPPSSAAPSARCRSASATR